MFWRNLDTLILDVYHYDIKIQTNTKQNSIKNLQKKFFNFFLLLLLFRAGSKPAHVIGLNRGLG
jgi:uncharacterized protein YihD (DUF1040 family)